MIKRLGLTTALFASLSLFAEFGVENSAKNNIAKPGETITFRAVDYPEGAGYVITKNGKRVEAAPYGGGDVKFSSDEPAWIVFKVERPEKDKDGKTVWNKRETGVVVAPEKMEPATSAPKNLDAFWAKIKKDVEKRSAAHPKLEKLRDYPAQPGKHAVTLYTFEIDVDGGEDGTCDGGRADGYLAIPSDKGGKMPIVATFYGAGSFGADLRDALNYAQEGAIGISMNPHSIPNTLKGQEREKFRREVLDAPGKNYRMWGIDDTPEKNYFVGMFKRVYQTLRVAMARPEWDGKNMAVRGFSQGGAQTIAAAYLCPKVTAIAPLCPAMCDNGAESLGRRSGWPDWVNGKTGFEKRLENGKYFDPALFAKKIRAEMYLGIGLLDNTCTPTAVTAMYNSYAGKKQKMYMQGVGHGWNDDWSKGERDFILRRMGLRK